MPPVEPNTISVWNLVATIIGVMVVGSVVRWIALRNSDPETRSDRLASLATWWGLAIVFCLALLGGQTGICCFMCAVSCIAFFEFDSVLSGSPVRVRLALAKQRWLFYLLILANYWLVFRGELNLLFFFIPAFGMIVTAALSILNGKTDGYIRETSGQFWGLFTIGYFLSFAVLVVQSGETIKTWDDQAGPFVFLVVLTQVNDIAQSIVGKKLGKANPIKLAPSLSPGKTWQGAIGGLLFTVLAAILLSYFLTDMASWSLGIGSRRIAVPLLPAVIAGILISVSGIFGDLNMSGLKRDAKVKDSSGLLPGMGGVIDRIDSLTFTAPVFYIYVNWICSEM